MALALCGLSTNRCFSDAISANPRVHLDLAHLGGPPEDLGPEEEAILPEERKTLSFGQMVVRN
jgi:hypothetical protein